MYRDRDGNLTTCSNPIQPCPTCEPVKAKAAQAKAVAPAAAVAPVAKHGDVPYKAPPPPLPPVGLRWDDVSQR